MADFYLGKNTRLYITTEATGSSVHTGSALPVSTSTGSGQGQSDAMVPRLGTAISYNNGGTGSVLMESVEIEMDPQREEIDMLGRNRKEAPIIRQQYKITINRPMQHMYYADLFNRGDHGAKETASATTDFRLSTAPRNATDGYRLYLWDETNSCKTYRNAIFESHISQHSPDGIQREQMVFSGNLIVVSASAFTSSTAASEL